MGFKDGEEWWCKLCVDANLVAAIHAAYITQDVVQENV